jgi:short-subunit dehydrogenase
VYLTGKNLLITGAASGMGRALAVAAAREGARLGLLDRQEKGLEILAQQLTETRAACAWQVADVRDRSALTAAVQELEARLGTVDILVAAAGITGATLVDDLAVSETEAIIQVNLLGVANTINAVLPGMLQRGQGQIVALSSLAGSRGMPFSAAYSASKAGLDRYLESLRPALRRRGIHVTTVLPGFVRTPLMENAQVRPTLPLMEPEVAAWHLLRAIRGRHRVYAFPWSTSLAIRWLCWLPAWLYDRIMTQVAARVPDLRY